MRYTIGLTGILFAGEVSGKWSDGTQTSDDPLIVLYSDDWAGWQRNFFPSTTESQVLSRKMPVRNWVINHAFLAWNPVACHIYPVDHEVDFSKGDTEMFVGAPTWWDPTMSSPSAGYLPSLMALKQKYPYIKLLPSIGGWSRSMTFHDCLLTKQDVMVQSTVDFINTYNLDGIDFDWEYPSCDGAPCGCQHEQTCPNTSNVAGAGDWERYKTFLTTLRAALDKLEDKLEKRLYITAALGVTPKLLDGNNDVWTDPTPIEWICDTDNFDWVNLMTYDFYGPWAAKTGPLSPLYPTPDEVCHEGPNQFSIEESLSRFFKRCSRPEKLTIGLPAYGKIWKSVPAGDGAVPGLWQSSTETTIFGGTGTWEAGTVSYWDITNKFLTSPDCKYTFDDASKTATIYCTKNPKAPGEKNIFITYDDGKAWEAKMAFAREHGMAGGIIWAASDLGHDNPQDPADLFGGAFTGWNGTPETIQPPRANGPKNFQMSQPWKNFPCPMPYVDNVDSFQQKPNPCYDNGGANDYATRTPWEPPAAKAPLDMVGKDQIMIHPMSGSPTDVPASSTTTEAPKPTTRPTIKPTTTTTTTTTTTKAPTTTTTTARSTTKASQSTTKTTGRSTTKATITSKPTTGRTGTTTRTTTRKPSPPPTTTGGSSAVSECAKKMDWVGQNAGWLTNCQSLCQYYAGSAWCPADSNDNADVLYACVISQAAYCAPPQDN